MKAKLGIVSGYRKMRKLRLAGVIVIILSQLICLQSRLYADEVVLKNQDRISGKVVAEDEETVTIDTEAIGQITIRKTFVEKIVTAEEKPVEIEEKPELWQREVSTGFNQSTGNTENIQFTLSLDVIRKTENNELTIKGNGYYSSSNGKMDAQKWYSMVRYARNIWNKKWTNFYKLEADHDKFSAIDYRLLPSTGIGYWLSDTPGWKSMVEGAVGLEHTDYNDETEDSDEAVFIGRVFLEKTFSGGSKISQDTSFYPSLSETGEYRIHSESSFTNPIGNGLSLRFSFIIDFDSEPPEDKEKTDTQVNTSLIYSF